MLHNSKEQIKLDYVKMGFLFALTNVYYEINLLSLLITENNSVEQQQVVVSVCRPIPGEMLKYYVNR